MGMHSAPFSVVYKGHAFLSKYNGAYNCSNAKSLLGFPNNTFPDKVLAHEIVYDDKETVCRKNSPFGTRSCMYWRTIKAPPTFELLHFVFLDRVIFEKLGTETYFIFIDVRREARNSQYFHAAANRTFIYFLILGHTITAAHGNFCTKHGTTS